MVEQIIDKIIDAELKADEMLKNAEIKAKEIISTAEEDSIKVKNELLTEFRTNRKNELQQTYLDAEEVSKNILKSCDEQILNLKTKNASKIDAESRKIVEEIKQKWQL